MRTQLMKYKKKKEKEKESTITMRAHAQRIQQPPIWDYS